MPVQGHSGGAGVVIREGGIATGQSGKATLGTHSSTTRNEGLHLFLSRPSGRCVMEDKVPVKILEIGEGEVVMIVSRAGKTTRLREEHLPRSQLPIDYVVERRLSERPRVADPPTFRREGQHWRVVFDGGISMLDDTVGVRHIARLLAEPGRELRCDTLLALLAGEPHAPAAGLADVATDARSLREYRAQLEHLGKDLEAARTEGDGERALLLDQERERLEAHLRAVTGKGGRSRKAVDGLERARQAVSAAIRRTMKVLKTTHPSLWRHLYNHMRIGLFCEYAPDPVVSWVTS